MILVDLGSKRIRWISWSNMALEDVEIIENHFTWIYGTSPIDDS